MAYSLNKELIELIYESDSKSILKKILDLKNKKERYYLKVKNNISIIYPKVFIKRDIRHYFILLTKKYAWQYERDILKDDFFVDYERGLITSNIIKKIVNVKRYIDYINKEVRRYGISISNIDINSDGYLFIKINNNNKSEIEEELVAEEFIYKKINNKQDIDNISTSGEYIKIYSSEKYMSYSIESNKEVYVKIKINEKVE